MCFDSGRTSRVSRAALTPDDVQVVGVCEYCAGFSERLGPRDLLMLVELLPSRQQGGRWHWNQRALTTATVAAPALCQMAPRLKWMDNIHWQQH